MVCRRRSAPASSRRLGGMAEGSDCADRSASVSIGITTSMCMCRRASNLYGSLQVIVVMGKVGGWPPSRHSCREHPPLLPQRVLAAVALVALHLGHALHRPQS